MMSVCPCMTVLVWCVGRCSFSMCVCDSCVGVVLVPCSYATTFLVYDDVRCFVCELIMFMCSYNIMLSVAHAMLWCCSY